MKAFNYSYSISIKKKLGGFNHSYEAFMPLKDPLI